MNAFRMVNGVAVEMTAEEVAEFEASRTPPPPTRDELLARSMHERWLAEEAGVYVGGVMIDSSRDSQSMMSKAVRYLEEKPDGTVIDYKTGDGFAPFGLAELKAVSILVGDHVQACFTREKTVNAAIRAGTYTTYEQVVAAYADLYPTAGG